MTNDEKKEQLAKERRQFIKAVTLFSQISISALCPIFILTVAGVWLDNNYGGGNHWFALAGAVIGVYSAYRNTYLLIRDTMSDKKDKKDEQSPPETKK